uniref:Uncharacterized protein n=1 Tax=Vannella robusta TaxID=1487602 RepID=A0A7S4MU48_9EUKA
MRLFRGSLCSTTTLSFQRRLISSSFAPKNNDLNTVEDYNKKMQKCIEDGSGVAATHLYRKMKENGITPNDESNRRLAEAALLSPIAADRAVPFIKQNEFIVPERRPEVMRADDLRL